MSMSIPKFSELFNDVLIVLSDGNQHHRRELQAEVLNRLVLTDAERAETMSGGGNRARSRVHWAFEFLCQSGATKRPKRGYAEITDFGRQLLQDNPSGISLELLRQTEGLKDWRRRSIEARAARRNEEELEDLEDDGDGSESADRTPHEQIENSIIAIEAAVASQLLQRLREEDPEFLERTVLKLLHAMGYGSSEDDLQHLGGSGDGGVDGVIRQDKFGLDQIYIQAKRYGSATVGRPDIQSFVGALTGQHATRGVFITTSSFSREAKEFARTIQQYRVILVDGEDLVRLMIENKVGVTVSRTVEVVEIDENFFSEQ
jgi:restriction system protein